MSDEKEQGRPLNEFELSDMFDEINKEHFQNKINKIPVTWNKSLRKAAGRCFYTRTLFFGNKVTPTKIDMAYKIFQLNNWDIEKVYNTLAHEMTHAFLCQEYNETGHTQRFNDIMTRITGTRKNHRFHSYQTVDSKKNVNISCSKCGHLGVRTRMPKRHMKYTHIGCGGAITFSKNNDSGDDFWKI